MANRNLGRVDDLHEMDLLYLHWRLSNLALWKIGIHGLLQRCSGGSALVQLR